MFLKLCKYEWKYMMRFFLPMWAVVLVLGVVNAFSAPEWLFYGYGGSRGSEIAGNLLFTALCMAFVAVCMVSVVVTIQRFYNGLLKDEGYLMFTLPVKSGALINSKCFVSVVLLFITSVVCVIAFVIMMAGSIGWGDFWDAVIQVFRRSDLTALEWFMIILWFIVLTLVGTAFSLYRIYTAMALGHLAKKHRVGWSVAAYLGMSLLGSLIRNVGLFNLDWNALGNFLEDVMTGMSVPQSIVTAELVLIVFYGVLALIFFFITRQILEKRLNLE